MKIRMSLIMIACMLAAPVAMGDVAGVYVKNCASCHGKDGKGQTTMGKKTKCRDYTDAAVQATFTDAEALKIILEGKGKMKGYKDKVTAAEAEALVKYVRAFKK